MSRHMTVKALGLALALAASTSTHAFAQFSPGASSAAPTSPQGQSAGQPLGQRLEDKVLVEGDPEANGHRVTPPIGARLQARDAILSTVSRRQWLERGWSNESFNAIERSNQSFCTKTATYIMHASHLLSNYAEKEPRAAELRDRYVNMAGDIKTAYGISTGANVIYGVGSWAMGPVTGVMGTAQAIGSQAQSRAWKKMMGVTRDAGILSQDLNANYIDFSIMSLETYQDYYHMVEDYCGGRYGGR